MLAPNNHPLTEIPASFPNRERWFVFFTHAKAERRAEESIRELGLPVFIPFEKRIRRHPRRKPVTVEAALFPGYGFVRFDMNDHRWGSIPGAKGVIDLLRCDRVPQSVSDGIVDSLRLADTMGTFDRTAPPRAGMSVEVMDGPFATFLGKIKKARSAERMEVLLNFLGSERAVEVPLAYLREV